MLDFFANLFRDKSPAESEAEKLRKVHAVENARSQIQNADRERLVALGKDILAQSPELQTIDYFSKDIFDKLENKFSAQEVALALIAYISNMDMERAGRITSSVIPRFEELIVNEADKERFDLNNDIDNKVVEELFGVIQEKLSEYKDTNDTVKVDIANDVHNAVYETKHLKEYYANIVVDIFVDGTYDARAKGWQILDLLDPATTSFVIKERIRLEPDLGALFIDKELKILGKKASSSKEGEAALLDLVGYIEADEENQTRLGYWDFLVEALAKVEERYQFLGRKRKYQRTISEIRRQSSAASEAESEKYRKENKPKVEKLRDSMNIDRVSLFAIMEEVDRIALLQFLNDGSDDAQLANETINEIFTVSDSSDISEDLLTQRNELTARAKKVISRPEFKKFIEAIIVQVYKRSDELEPDYDLAFRLALLSAFMDPQEIAPSVKSVMELKRINNDFQLSARNGDWYLCDMSEHRLIAAMLEDGAILVNGKMLMKFEGKKSALCLETFIDAETNETFYKGVWYAITDSVSKSKLKQAYNRGDLKCEVHGIKWAVMRALRKDDSDYSDVDGPLLMAAAENYAKKCKRKSKTSKDRQSLDNIAEAN